MTAGGIPVTVVASGGAPMTPVGLTADMVLADGDQSVQEALDDKQPLGGQRGVHALLPKAAGDYYSNANNASALSTWNAANQRMDFFPYLPARDHTVDLLAGYVTTGVASAKGRIGVYGDSGAGYPGALLADSGDLDCATTNSTISHSVTAVTLKAGEAYWLAVHTNSTQVLRSTNLASCFPVTAPDGSATTPATVYRGTQTYGALPATAPAGMTATGNLVPPFVRLRAA